MSLQTIEIEAFSGPTSVLIGGGNQPTIVYINQGPAGSAGSGTWGGITGTLSSQTDLQDALDLKANLASPTFTGTVVLPSATSIGNVSATEIGYVDGVTSAIQTQLNAKAPLASPTFTGIVTAPRITGRCDGLEVFSKAGQAINAGQVVYVTGASGTNVIIGLAQANTESTSSRTIGISESTLAHNATGYVITEGLMTVSISAPTANAGDPIWLSGTTAGGMLFGEANKPVYPYHVVYLGVVTRKTGNTVVEIYVKVQNGFQLDELSDVLITTPLANQSLVRNSDRWINRALVSLDISDSSYGGNNLADFNKLVKFNVAGGLSVSSVNKVTITQPANFATLTIADGKTINAQGSISTSATGSVSTTAGGSFATGTGNLTGPNTSGTIALTSDIPPAATVDTTVIDGSTNAVSGNAVFDALALKAPLDSPVFTGSVTTSGDASISTSGLTAEIFTQGVFAHISTRDSNAHIQSRSTFKLFDGVFTTTLSHSPTDDRAIAFPNASGTVALINPSSGTQTFSGAQIFSSTTRPTSSGTGTPAATSLITLADGDARYGATGLAGTSAILITSQITPQTIRSAALAVGLYHIRMVFLLAGTANTGTRHGYNFSGTSTVRFFRSRASSSPLVQVSSNPFDQPLTEANTSAVIEGIISVTVAGTFSMQAAQNTSHPDVLNVGASNHMIITPCPKGSIS